MSEQSNREQQYIAILIAVTLVSFFPIVYNGFTNWDDGYHLLNNPDVAEVSWRSISAVFSSFYVGHYIPLVMLSFMTEHFFYGFDPFYFHFTSLVLHVLTTVMIFTLARRWKCSVESAFFAAVLFGIHPMHVEPVAWVSARKDTLSGFFLIASLLSFYRSIETDRRSDYAGSLFLFLCSLCSKASGMFLPYFLVIHMMSEKRLNRRILLKLMPFFILSFIAAALAVIALHDARGLHIGERFNGVQTISIVCYNILFYIEKTVIPVGISSVYPFPDVSYGILPVAYVVAPFIVAAGAVCLFFFRNKIGWTVIPLAFFFIGMLPTLQIIPFGSMTAADRFVYIPIIGLLVSIVSVAQYWCSRNVNARYAYFVGAAAVVIMFSAITWDRLAVWKDSEALWTDAISKAPDFPIAYYSRGQYYFSIGDYDRAYTDFSKAIDLAPVYPNALNMRGYLNAVRGKVNEARRDFDNVIRFQPNNAVGYYNRGLLFFEQKKIDSAAMDFSGAIRYDSTFTEAFVYRGRISMIQQRYQNAVEDFTSALYLQPNHREALISRGTAEIQMNEFVNAESDLRKALSFDPLQKEPYLLLSALYRKKGMMDSAAVYYEKSETAGGERQGTRVQK